MAKADFCFTFYDGDAARDMQHMDRLARGGYMDFILSQRKFGRLSMDFIKRILGKDWGEIWPQIEIICVQDASGKFYIEWLEKSEEKARLHSKHQSENGKKGGRPKKSQTKPNENPNKSQLKPNEKPLEDGDGDGDEYRNEDSLGKSENPFLENWDSIKMNFFNGWQWKEKFCRDKNIEMPVLEEKMNEFINDIELREEYKPLKDLRSHFVNTYNKKNGRSTTYQQPLNGSSKIGTSEARTEALKKW